MLTVSKVLEIGATREVVEVTSQAPQVDTSSTQLGAVINDRSVNELPLNARDTYQFLQLQPGVQSQLGSGNGSLFYGAEDVGSVSVNGGRGRSNNFSVNGGDANDQFVNLPTVQPTPDSVAEFRVITNTFDAEYGRNSGSVVNVITKSGSNSLHGDVYEYFRNTVLNAQGYFNTIKPQLNQNQFGGTLGGPIKKDRTFFFVSYEGRRIRQGDPGQVVGVPTLAQRSGDFSGVGTPTNLPGIALSNTAPLIGNKEKGPVLLDRSAQGAAKLVLIKLRLDGIEIALRVQHRVPQILVNVPMQTVAAGLGDYVANRSSIAHLLGVHVSQVRQQQSAGDVFAYLRNTVLNAQGYFDSIKPQLIKTIPRHLGDRSRRTGPFLVQARHSTPGVPTLAQRSGAFRAWAVLTQ